MTVIPVLCWQSFERKRNLLLGEVVEGIGAPK
jgi:hypothetical protein